MGAVRVTGYIINFLGPQSHLLNLGGRHIIFRVLIDIEEYQSAHYKFDVPTFTK